MLASVEPIDSTSYNGPVEEMAYSNSNPRSWNQLLKGDTTKGKHELTIYIPAIRNLLVRYEQLNQAVIEYIKSDGITNKQLVTLKNLPSEILRRTIYDSAAYNEIVNANKQSQK